VLPWVVLGSLGFHTVLQTQVALGMSLSVESRSGRILGNMAGIGQAGALVGMGAVFVLFLRWPDLYHEVYVVCGLIALLGAAAIIGFPHLHEGKAIAAQMPRQRIVIRRDYRYYYVLNVLDGARQQLFFSFGLWVLVSRFGMGVSAVSLVVIVSTVVAMVFSPWAGRMIDRHGERHTLSAINVAYIVALAGYALMGNVRLACVFYVLYSFIAPFSAIGAATYLRKIAVPADIAPSLAMGVTLLHATAIVVPVAAGALFALLPFLVAERDYTLAAVGTFALVANVTNGACQPLFGARGDLREARWMLPLGLVLAGVGVGVAGVTTHFAATLLAVVVCMAGVAAYHPEGARLARGTVAGRIEAKMGVFSVGGGIGYMLGPLLVAAVLASLGLGGTALVGLVPLLAAAGVALALRRDGADVKEAARESARSAGAPEWRPFALLVGMFCLSSAIATGLLVYLPVFLVDARGTSPAAASIMSSIMMGAGAGGMVLGGLVAQRFSRRLVLLAPELLMPAIASSRVWATPR
jgi:FSR family fosmidomycin resistance protein-like MFS transporter